MFGKRYNNILILDNSKDAMLYATKEGLRNAVNEEMIKWLDRPDVSFKVTIPKEVTYLQAIKKSLEYNKIGIFTLIVEVS